MILVSACLLGVNCRYDGTNNKNLELIKLLSEKNIFPVCPEELGELTTPRPPAEIQGREVLEKKGRVMNTDGQDVTEAFIKGAEETLKLAEENGVTTAILKARSPSCGSGKIYDGSFTGTLTEGDGVTAALLKRKNIKVYTEENFLESITEIENLDN
ncbi:DUF523 domain-containing protein [Clostridium formicaceticum]|uniref:Purine-nucleoside phosphorylase n=1 Tax=Clostridium formicaceticum TaxID=1497 RepID=A0AAC9RJW2_9CLOT|nr:DUF523 domain-containing protein [Clostridium formicaceticum]AOY76435.1 hypothetical protein BJL90_11260 [Clostridium formicaceticum]ARE86830.1 hypothetical protein CLFO_11610 [Clostridium formicaceticum]